MALCFVHLSKSVTSSYQKGIEVVISAGEIFSDPANTGSLSALIVAAHPDDEVFSMGGHFPLFKNTYFAHATDGAPLNMRDALKAGFSTRESYAYARSVELQEAPALASINAENCFKLGFIDQEASAQAVLLTLKIKEILERISVDVVFTHAYEGGHPDHDTAAFACHAGIHLIKRERAESPGLVEFTSYHMSEGEMVTCRFIPSTQTRVIRLELSSEQSALKKKMMDCFKTQLYLLADKPLEIECFRDAPEYDFTLPPSGEKLFYEYHDFGMTGRCWRELASQAYRTLDISGPI